MKEERNHGMHGAHGKDTERKGVEKCGTGGGLFLLIAECERGEK